LDRSISPVRANRVGEGHPRVTRVAVLRHLGQRPTLRLARLTAPRIRDLMSDSRESLVGAARSDYIRVAIAVGKGGRAADVGCAGHADEVRNAGQPWLAADLQHDRRHQQHADHVVEDRGGCGGDPDQQCHQSEGRPSDAWTDHTASAPNRPVCRRTLTITIIPKSSRSPRSRTSCPGGQTLTRGGQQQRELGIAVSGAHVLDLPAPWRDDLHRGRPRSRADLAHEPRDHPAGFHREVLSDHIALHGEPNPQVNDPRSPKRAGVARVRQTPTGCPMSRQKTRSKRNSRAMN